MALEPHVLGPMDPQVDGSTADLVIAALADHGDGVVSRVELLAAGVSPEQIKVRLRRGSLRPLYPGVYAVGHRVLTQQGRWRAALLAAGAGAVLSHRSAGQLWSVAGEGREIDVSVPARRRRQSGLRLHEALVPPDEVAVVGSLQVTTVARTLIDLAAVLRRHQLERAVRSAEQQHLGDATPLHSLLTRHRGRRGITNLRAVLHTADLTSITRSEFEDRFVSFCRRRRLPRPSTNATLLGFEIDLVWRDAGLAGELDGYASHGTRVAFERDRERDRKLVAAGWRTIRITWRQLRDDPDSLAGDLRAILEPHVVGR